MAIARKSKKKLLRLKAEKLLSGRLKTAPKIQDRDVKKRADCDVTDRKRLEEELRKSRDELEICIQERTAELMEAIEELQDEISEGKRIEKALTEQSRILEGFFISTVTPLVFLGRDFNFIRVNEAYAKACQRDISEFHGHNHFEFYPSDAKKIFEQVVETKVPYQAVARPFIFPDHPEWGVTYWNWILTPLSNDKGEVEYLVFSVEDVTERKRAEHALREAQKRTEAINYILSSFAKTPNRREDLNSVTELIHSWSDCRCAGIQVLDVKNYIPYESYVGFSREFWESENLLSINDDQCACIRVVTSNPDPQDRPVMTPAGSFRCENTFEFVGNLTEEEKTRFRGVCIENGFKSVAIVPIRYRDRILGAIHLADEEEGKVGIGNIQFIESVAPLIGEALNRFNLEEELKDSEARLRYLSTQLLTVQENEKKALRGIFMTALDRR